MASAMAGAPVTGGGRFALGLVVGKFAPLHRGHLWLIDQAAAQCERVLVLSYSNPEFPGCSPQARRRWLAECCRGHEVVVLDAHEVPPNDAPDAVQQRFLATLLRDRLQRRPDAMFASEAYLQPCAAVLAEAFGHPVAAVMGDPQRLKLDVSATRVRARPVDWLELLPPVVRADVVPRIVLLGGESTGKTTLAAALALRLGTAWVAEYGRELWECQGGHLQPADMPLIAQRQWQREVDAARQSRGPLVCDTSALTTLGYALWTHGHADAELAMLADRPYDLTVLCGDGVPFVQDGTRRDAGFRSEQQRWYRTQLASRGIRWVEVEGTVASRVAQVVSAMARADLLPARFTA